MSSILVPGRVFQLVTFVGLFAATVLSIRHARKGHPIVLRTIGGFDALEECVGRAVEMGRPIHFCPGVYSLSIEVMAGLHTLGHLAKLAAQYDAGIVVSVARGDTYAVADAIVKEAFAEAGKPDSYKPEMVRFLSDNQWAFVSGILGIMTRERVAANIMVGQWAADSLVTAESGYALGAMQIAGTARTTQLPFFVATCDYVLIGEEIFAAEAYFSKDPDALGCIRGEDITKAFSLGLLLIGILCRAFNSDALVKLMAK